MLGSTFGSTVEVYNNLRVSHCLNVAICSSIIVSANGTWFVRLAIVSFTITERESISKNVTPSNNFASALTFDGTDKSKTTFTLDLINLP